MDIGTGLAAGGAFALLIAAAIFAVIGVIIGALARLLLPGRDDISIGKTILYGIGGSFLGGILGRLLGIEGGLLGFALAVAAAMALIWFFTRRKPGA
jgi:uncharacterized membrane protein YeaQ/YmgE (transglycosylase-associated protein family)